jgi:hypothetical protein
VLLVVVLLPSEVKKLVLLVVVLLPSEVKKLVLLVLLVEKLVDLLVVSEKLVLRLLCVLYDVVRDVDLDVVRVVGTVTKVVLDVKTAVNRDGSPGSGYPVAYVVR